MIVIGRFWRVTFRHSPIVTFLGHSHMTVFMPVDVEERFKDNDRVSSTMDKNNTVIIFADAEQRRQRQNATIYFNNV